MPARRASAAKPTPAQEDPNPCLQTPKPVKCILEQKKRQREKEKAKRKRKNKIDAIGFEVGTGVNLGINQSQAGEAFHWYYGVKVASLSLRLVWGSGRHFAGLGWELHSLSRGVKDDSPEDLGYQSFVFVPWYRYQRELLFFEVAPFIAYDFMDFAGAGLFSRVGVMKKVGPWRLGVGLGGGWGAGVQYLNLMVITGFHF